MIKASCLPGREAGFGWWLTFHSVFYKTSTADKHLLGYSNTSEHLNHSSGFVNPPRNTLKDSVYSDAEIRGAARQSAGGDGGFENRSPNHTSSLPPWFILIHLDPCEKGDDNDGKELYGCLSSPWLHPLSFDIDFRGKIASLFTTSLIYIQEHIRLCLANNFLQPPSNPLDTFH